MKGAEKIKLFAFDVDGTLTPGTLIFGENGEAYKAFHARDGMVLGLAHHMGYITGLITGRTSDIVKARAKELSMDFVVMGARDKAAALEEILTKYNLSWDEAAFMGDDLNDLPLFGRVGLCGCPADGCAEAKGEADFVSSFKGGAGAAREFVEEILKEQGRWQEAVDICRGVRDFKPAQ